MPDLFSWVPDWNAQMDEEARVRKADFGDGYQQRTADGLNPILQRWRVGFVNRPKTAIAAIASFLRSHAVGGTAFEFPLPDAGLVLEDWKIGDGDGSQTQFLVGVPTGMTYASPPIGTHRPITWHNPPTIRSGGTTLTEGADYTLAPSGLLTFTSPPTATFEGITVSGEGEDRRLVVCPRTAISIVGVDNHTLTAEFHEVLA